MDFWIANLISFPVLWHVQECLIIVLGSCCCRCLVSQLYLTLLRLHGLQPTSLLCPWDFPSKNIRVGCHFLLQGIFLIEGSNLCHLYLLYCRQILYPLSHWGSPQLSHYYCCLFWTFFFFAVLSLAVHRLSLVVVNGGYSSLWCVGFSLWSLLLLWSTDSRWMGFSGCGAGFVALQNVISRIAGGFLWKVLFCTLK